MRTLFALLILVLLVTGCGAPAQAEVARSSVPRETAPNVTNEQLDTLVEGNVAFSVDLYRALQEREGNLFFSPHSISVALAMTYAGARGETAEQMAETLHFTLPQEQLHAAFNALDLELTSDRDVSEEDFILTVANSLWAEEDYTFRDEFLDLLARNYDAGLRLVSFKTAAEAARQAINAWVSEQTEGRIEDLIPEGGVDEMTRLVLANAIYFNAKWVHTFPKENTESGAFDLLDGGQVDVDMMSWDDPNSVPYAAGEGYQAIELPYRGDSASMVLIVPHAGNFETFEEGLTGDQLQSIVAAMEIKSVALTMPKFSYEAETSLAATLAEMGMPAATDPTEADFSGMDGTRQIYISDVFHKAFVAVDEEGTEAAAATAVVVGVTSLPSVDVELTVDRPFIYLIRDTGTGEVLFLGRVLNPAD